MEDLQTLNMDDSDEEFCCKGGQKSGGQRARENDSKEDLKMFLMRVMAEADGKTLQNGKKA